MEEQRQVPERWIGEQVTVHTVKGMGYGTLNEVFDRGLLLEDAETTVPVFFPWGSIVSIRLGAPERPERETPAARFLGGE